MIRHYIFLALGVLCLAGASPEVMADEPRELGRYSDWSAHVFTEDGNKVCYMASQPKKSEGDYTRRGPVYALITHRPSEGSKNVFSYIAGYPYKLRSNAALKIDSETFTLFTQDETAWASDAEEDNRIAAFVRKGSKMVVTGESVRGTPTADTFSLKGSAAAQDAIARECGVR